MRHAAARRVLVTGGAGFIGSFLRRRLSAAGREVLCVDNYTGRRANIAHLIDHPNLDAMRHDIACSPETAASSRLEAPAVAALEEAA